MWYIHLRSANLQRDNMQELPRHLIQLLKTSKYLHLATASKDGVPSVSLMNYTYIPSDNDQNTEHYVVFSTAINTEKYQNILANPVVSLLIHDWMTAKKLSLLKSSLSTSASRGKEDFESEDSGSSSLFNLLHDLNQAELSQMSATMRGLAQVIDPASEECHIYKTALLKANPDAECFIQGDNTAIIRVQLERAKISDSDNNTSIYQ